FRAQKLRKSLKKFVIIEENEFKGFGEEDEGEIKVGDRVLVNALKTEGEVLSVNPIKNDAKVKLGKITTNVKLADLTRLKKSEKKERNTPSTKRVLFNEQVSPEINLIGKTSIEAEQELNEYLDKVVRVGLHEVRIIHGYGEGILRKKVGEVLKNRPEIDKYRDGEYGEGGKGVTIAYFK
ncbi:MAG: Smr/MutS family protein, partial [Clostridia bacterium]|nr:Smr/MutS family protein [Clostridia bacterium]